jgi:hypothetical protein
LQKKAIQESVSSVKRLNALKPNLKAKVQNSMTEPTEKPKEEPTEKLPISEFYKVIDYVTIFKSAKWWEAIVVYESFGKRSIGL